MDLDLSLMPAKCNLCACICFVPSLCMGFAPHTLSDDISYSANGLIASTAKVSAACIYPNGSCV